jgi:hypothetical protein
VQIWSGNDNGGNDNGFPRRNWDSHEDVERDHGPLAWGMAKAVSALILDLKQRGLLDDTIILWTTEFGRMPARKAAKAATTTPTSSPTGSAAAASKAASPLARATNGATSRSTAPIRRPATTSTPR